MENCRCRTCFEITDTRKCIEISKLCYLEKTIKEVIIMLVPDMKSTLLDHESICKHCFKTLKSSIEFIERCLEVELINANEKKQFQECDDISDYACQDNELKESKEALDNLHTFLDLDHSYVKKEQWSDNENDFSQSFSTSVEGLPELPALKNDDSSDSSIEYLCYESLSLYEDNEEENENNVTLESSSLLPETKTSGQDVDCVKMEAEQDTFSCSNCSEKFSCEDQYKLHLEVHSQDMCQLCGEDCKTKDSHKNHTRLHGSYFIVCEFCGKLFKSSSCLYTHLTEVHSVESLFLCDKCPKKYKNKSELSLHERMVHDREKQRQCQECGKLFLNKDSYLSHYRLTHLKLRPYVCEICGMEFGRKDYLQKHMQSKAHFHGDTTSTKKRRVTTSGIILVDPGEPVTCKVCGKTYPALLNLKAHLQTHVKVKRYKCQYCSLTFSVKGNCVRHEKLHEADPEHKFRCNICWKKMKTEEELEQHVVIHSNRPPNYACEICGEKFHRRYLLDNHHLDVHTDPGDIEKAETEIVLKNLMEYADPTFL